MGESGRQLAKEFKVSEATIRANISTHPADIRDVAERLAQAEVDLANMPINAQISTRTLADRLKGLTDSLVTTATIQGKTAAIMAKHGLNAAQSIQPGAGVEELRTVAACTELANKAGQMGMGLLTATAKGKSDPEPDASPFTPEQLRRMADLQERK